MNDPIVYLNGEYLPRSQAKISVLDRGFLFADGIYEVIPVYSGKLFGANKHIERLTRSLKALYLNNPYSHSEWLSIFQRLLEQYENYTERHYSIYLHISRGADKEREHFIPNFPLTPTVFVQATELISPALMQLEKGFPAITINDIRWGRCNIKSTALIANVLLLEQARSQGAIEAILIHNGYVTEGTKANVFIVKKGMLLTPPEDHKILSGVTRNIILELAKRYQLPFQEIPVSYHELINADEIWITSSSKDLLPIVQLNDKHVGTGKTGDRWREMYTYFQAYKKE